jgi:hypothetical protein
MTNDAGEKDMQFYLVYVGRLNPALLSHYLHGVSIAFGFEFAAD